MQSLWQTLWQDLRYTLRGLRNAPGYAATVILTLALGLGVVTTMLSIVDSVLLRPVALPYPEQLVMLWAKGTEAGTTYTLSYKRIEALRRQTHTFSAVSGYNTNVRPIGTTDGTRMTLLTTVTPQFFNTLGVHAKLGRLLSDADRTAPVAVVSAVFWQERLHGDPHAIGKTIQLNGKLRTVVGVLPEGVRFPQGTEVPAVYTPIDLKAGTKDAMLDDDSAMVMARLRRGVSRQQALAEVRSVMAHSGTENAVAHETFVMTSYEDYLTGGVQTALLALLGGVGILLIIACANAANLQIARATGRMAEMNVRSALGASFSRLAQQAMTESIVVSLLGAMLGSAFAYTLVAAVRRTYGQQFSRFDELAVHPTVFAACAVLAILVGLLASLAPVPGIRRRIGVKATTTQVTRRSRLPGILAALQITLTCVLLVVIGLFVRTFQALENVKLGFDPHGVTTMVLMPEDQHKDPELARQTDTRLLERFNALPGVQAATMQTAIPFSSYNFFLNGTTEVDGRPFHEGDTAFYSMVSTNFIHASGLHLLRGRGLLAQDDASAAMVAIVNEAFVKQYLPTRDPLGANIKAHRKPGETDADIPFTQPLTVVGVVENELQGGDLGAPLQPMVYLDYRQLPKGSLLSPVFSLVSEFAVRSTLPQSVLDKELRTAVKQIAPDMTEMSLQSMETGIRKSLSERRLALRLVAAFSGAALLLAAVGIYGVLAYSVAQRTREIGIRMALGCTRAGTLRLVAGQAAAMALAGLALGLAGAWPAGRAVRSFLFGVPPFDPLTLTLAALLLLTVCTAAAAIPAYRATQVDPIEALRTE